VAESKQAEGSRQRAEGRGKIADLSFGLPPFGRVPSFGSRKKLRKQKAEGRRN
jgi:hypothetical protein